MDKKIKLTVSILVGLILGVIVGQLMYDPTWSPDQSERLHRFSAYMGVFKFFGFTIFIGLLKMLIIPLVLTSVVVGVTSVGDFRTLGRLGSWTITYYAATMIIAVAIGLVAVLSLNPGESIGDTKSLNPETAFATQIDSDKIVQTAESGIIGVFENLFGLMIPENFIQAMSDSQTLGVIVFGIFFGVVATMVGAKARPVIDLFEGAFLILMRMVDVVLYLAPIGVFCLLAWTIARMGLGVFSESIGLYMLTVMGGLAIHAFIVLPGLLFLFGRTNPFIFMHQMRDAFLTAFATDSSSATLPVTMECATKNAGVDSKVAGLVLPLGSTVNMDGTALYEAVAVVFLAQAFNVELGMSQLIIIAITATLAAVGAAGIPSAGLVTMVIVLEATNQSLTALDPAAATIPITGIGLILGVDRILDMFRTTVNVWGDSVGAKIIDQLDKR